MQSNIDEILLLVQVLPPFISSKVEKHPRIGEIIEIVMDVGRTPEIRFPDDFEIISSREIMYDDIEYVVKRIGEFGRDNRAGIPRTLHRISAIRNRNGVIVGLTCRVGRAVYGAADILLDYIKTGKSLLILGRPGVGKTTILRETARIINDNLKKRVVIVDTSNEIGGDGDIPHPAIGRARRMQVPSPDLQHKVMIEAVENHMPEVIIIDEMGTQEEAYAARTIAERGVQLIATAHGNNLENIVLNPTLSDIVGGIQAVILSDEEAKRRGTQKTVLERKNPPTFDILVEIVDRNTFAIYSNVALAVDFMLKGITFKPEIRVREDNEYKTVQKEYFQGITREEPTLKSKKNFTKSVQNYEEKRYKIYPFAISVERLQKAITELEVPLDVVYDINQADFVITLKSKKQEIEKKIQKNPTLYSLHKNIMLVRSNTLTQISKVLEKYFDSSEHDINYLNEEIEEKIKIMYEKNLDRMELDPQPEEIRRIQHELIEKYGLYSKTEGEEPNKKVTIYKKRI
ncbi:MAG: R3H domain-containing nucleic acid-binding protein [Candidatus Calescibacterium sp.]|nr:AAA family ATPase [Candidatus Calescibacterium sp.]MDW8132525.1 R3H domain-containing nucleic acid-binding protein [Candidatus Calescibacterium sp.]